MSWISLFKRTNTGHSITNFVQCHQWCSILLPYSISPPFERYSAPERQENISSFWRSFYYAYYHKDILQWNIHFPFLEDVHALQFIWPQFFDAKHCLCVSRKEATKEEKKKRLSTQSLFNYKSPYLCCRIHSSKSGIKCSLCYSQNKSDASEHTS